MLSRSKTGDAVGDLEGGMLTTFGEATDAVVAAVAVDGAADEAVALATTGLDAAEEDECAAPADETADISAAVAAEAAPTSEALLIA